MPGYSIVVVDSTSILLCAVYCSVAQCNTVWQAIALWDIKQAEELKCFLNSLLYHYIMLEVRMMLITTVTVTGVLQDTVWEATSSVTGGRRTACSLASIYC